MQIVRNGQWRDVPDGASLAEALDDLPSTAGIAVALDGAVVRRAHWPDTVLRPGARIDVLTAVPGG